jgi:tetratricopeptide (TPR) repeat protein
MAEPDNSGMPPDSAPGSETGNCKKSPPPGFLNAIEAFQKGAESNNAEQMEAAALKALAIAAAAAEKNPTPDLILLQQAADCETLGDWTTAEAKHREVLKLAEDAGQPASIASAYYHLSKLFQLIGDVSRAEDCAERGLASARQAQTFPLQVMALSQKTGCALSRADYAAALLAANESVAVIEPGRMHDLMRAGALVTRARCRLGCGDLAGCQSDLCAAKPVLVNAGTSPLFAGSQSRTAGWWEVTARARAQEGDLNGACDAWSEAVQKRRHVHSLSHVTGPHTLAALARALGKLAEALDAAGRIDSAKTSQAEAQMIWGELGLSGQTSF